MTKVPRIGVPQCYIEMATFMPAMDLYINMVLFVDFLYPQKKQQDTYEQQTTTRKANRLFEYLIENAKTLHKKN